MGDVIRNYVSQEEINAADRIVRAMGRQDFGPYQAWMARPENLTLRGALKILRDGLKYRLEWDGSQYVRKERKQKGTLGPALIAFLRRTRTLIMFTDGFGRRSTTGGGQVNGAWQEGEYCTVGTGKEKYKYRRHNILWLSSDLRDSPAAIAMLIAHEVGHGIATEYRDNYFPLPVEAEKLSKPPYTYFPHHMDDDDDQLCYPMEAMMARELGMAHYTVQADTPMTAEARRWYRGVFGEFNTSYFREWLRLDIVYSRGAQYEKRTHYCGMRCKHFKEYGYCSRKVSVPPCYQYAQHLEGWLTPDTEPDRPLPEGFAPLPAGDRR